ncbi:MAG TPA: hypothetical protein VFJ68_05290 [Casimicrobiaceae bacterium]|nr:hypothetical protein [Casimicrobiaceae bacterium]
MQKLIAGVREPAALAFVLLAAATIAAPVAAQQPMPAQSAQASAASEDTWPHTFTGPNGGTATVYQPQVISWPDFKTLNARTVIGIAAKGASAPTLGTIELAFATQTSLEDRIVTLTEPRLVSSSFPTLDAARAAEIEQRIRAALATMPVKRVPLATLVISLRREAQKPPEVALDNSPPRIFYSARPASLVVFDGEPVLSPIAGTTLSFAVNTNWDVFSDSATKTWYLLWNGGWLSAADVKGPWAPAARLPAGFSALPADKNFAEVKKQIPGRPLTARDAPTIFVSMTPAAIIVTDGRPQYVAISGTSLQYAANTDAALFRDARTSTVYYLVSGRWFSAPGIDGPWTFATSALPPDFARIPANGPRGFVLVSVPGTPQAQEALLEAQIPQQATLNRSAAKLEVIYSGPPQFVPIAGTQMFYATNTSFSVVRYSDGYYSCYQGAWFTSTAPAGPWVLADSVPAVIYSIPPSSPLYSCTFVRVYAASPDTVTYGYTSGYTMSYVAAGVVVYGTGYYYPPYIYPAPIPIYYPYPYSYAGAMYYNSTSGAWAYGGAIYGPYGGVAKAGTYYNPTTGAWAHGGAVYGPYGGAGAFSAYNPTTGSYAHGGAVWGPDGAAGNASWYNANTGRSGTTQQNANAYGRWGSSTISGPNQTVHTQSQSNARGSAGSFSSSTGAKGGAVSGAGGNTAGAVKTASGDVYAGADGNVYKKTSDGWEKYNNGSWSPVQQPKQGSTTNASQSASSANRQSNLSGQTESNAAKASDQRSARQSNISGQTESNAAKASNYRSERQGDLSGQTERGGQFRSEGGGFGQLDQDREARMGGGMRQQQFQSMRGGFAGHGGGFRR